jgi:membrane protein DedA with SNARE-associated domain
MRQVGKELSVIIIGAIFYVIGIVLKLNASTMAWPLNYSYNGERADTSWAIQEQSILDMGLSLMIFGLVIIVIAIISILWNDRQKVEEK